MGKEQAATDVESSGIFKEISPTVNGSTAKIVRFGGIPIPVADSDKLLTVPVTASV